MNDDDAKKEWQNISNIKPSKEHKKSIRVSCQKIYGIVYCKKYHISLNKTSGRVDDIEPAKGCICRSTCTRTEDMIFKC
jgi:hypothetical protein